MGKKRHNKGVKIVKPATPRVIKPTSRVGLFDMPKFSDIMPFLKEVIQEKATGVKFKSSDIEPPIENDPPSFRDIMVDDIENGRITYNKARGFAEAKISAEERVVKQIISKMNKLVLHEQISYGFKRPSKGLQIYDANEQSRKVVRQCQLDFKKAKKAVVHSSLMQEIVQRGADLTADEAVLALWNAEPPSENLFIEWNEPTKQWWQQKIFHKKWGICNGDVASSIVNPSVGYWIRKTEEVDGVYLGDSVYTLDSFLYLTNAEYDKGIDPSRVKYVNNKVYIHDMRMVVNFAKPFDDEIIEDYRQSPFELTTYGKKYLAKVELQKRMQEILYPHDLTLEQCMPSALNVDRALWGNIWSYHNSKKRKDKKDWGLLRKHIMWKPGLGHEIDPVRNELQKSKADYSSLLGSMGDIRFLVSLLNIWNYPRYVTQEVRESKGKRTIIRGETIPTDEHVVLRVNLPKDEGVKLYRTDGNGQGGNGTPKKYHEVEAHTRVYPTLYNDDGSVKRKGFSVRVKEHGRGNERLGTITKEYKLMGKENRHGQVKS
jgi:hypothetical protein